MSFIFAASKVLPPRDFNLNLYHIINMVEQDTTATFKELLNSKLKQVTKNK